MANRNKFSTQVYQLPTDEADRIKFTSGVEAIAAECKATWVAGSVHDELSYVEILEKALTREIGDRAVEKIRQMYERT